MFATHRPSLLPELTELTTNNLYVHEVLGLYFSQNSSFIDSSLRELIPREPEVGCSKHVTNSEHVAKPAVT